MPYCLGAADRSNPVGTLSAPGGTIERRVPERLPDGRPLPVSNAPKMAFANVHSRASPTGDRLPKLTRAVESIDQQSPTVEIPLIGGRTTAGIVRVGETVHRPQTARSPFVRRLLQAIATSGFTGAPRFIGVDDRQREVLSFLPGVVPSDLGAFTDVQLDAAARLLRALHDATRDSDLRGTCEVVCHGDPSPCNAVFRDGLPYAWIDFDSAYPGNRSEDLGYAAWLWLDIGDDAWAPEVQARRLARFFEEYGAAHTIVPLNAVLDAQTRLCQRDDGPRQWAEACRLWTEQHRHAFSA